MTLVGFGSAPVQQPCFKVQQMSVFVKAWQKHRHINPSLTCDLHYNNYTFSPHWGKAILMLGWMGSTGHTCASQAVLESLLSPQGQSQVLATTTTPLKSPKQQCHPQKACGKKPLWSTLILSPINSTLHPAELQNPTHRAGPSLASWLCCSHWALMLHRQSEILIHIHLNIAFFHTQNLKSACEKVIYIYIYMDADMYFYILLSKNNYL